MHRILALLVSCLLFQPHLFAYCSILPRLVRAEFSQSKLVVIAKLVRKQHHSPPHDQDYHIYSLETIRVLRGYEGREFRILEENDSGRAPFHWKVGTTYLLFLDPDKDGMWQLYGCGNSAPLGEARSALRVIASLKEHRGGIIQGLVVTDKGAYPPSIDLSGIVIHARSEIGEYTAVTNRMGEFNLSVPAGKYALLPVQPGARFETDVGSYEDPNSLSIENGGAAQVQFQRDTQP